MATKTKRHRSKNPRGPASGRGAEARIEDVSEASVVFTLSAKGIATNVTDAIEEGKLEETMHGASGLNLELLDRDYGALNGGLFDSRVRCVIDGAPFRLVQPGLPDDWKLSALFEHALVAEMREHTKPLKARRKEAGKGGVTRAEFILMMLRELKMPFVFVCPELHRKQKTPPAEKTKETVIVKSGHGKTKTVKKKAKAKAAGIITNLADVEKGPMPTTITRSPTKSLTAKHAALTHAQVDLVTRCLEAARNTNANRLSMTALVVALIQENDISNPDPGNPGDRGCLSITDSTARGIQAKSGHGLINVFDPTEVSEHFCTAGYTGAGGSNALARAHPSWTPAHIGSVVQGPEKPYPETWNAEAFDIVDAFLATGVGGAGGASAASFSGGGPSETSTTVVKTATAEFSRGQPGQIESTFECALRLAEEVNWRFFVSGRNEIYFVNDDDLLKAFPRYIIKPDTPGFEKITFDVEVGARTVVEHGKREPKPSEATLVVRADRWAAPPGCVIALEGWGVADHPWLVDEVQRSLYDSETTIQLRAPQHPLEEPKATASGTGSPGKEIVGGEGGAEDPTNVGGSGEPTASRSVEKKLASEHPELHAKVRHAVAIILTQFPELTITSTTGGNHVANSYHYRGMAADLAGANMDAIGSWIAKHMTPMLTEGIHNPTLAVNGGHAVNGPSFYAAVWPGHKDHIHIAVAG